MGLQAFDAANSRELTQSAPASAYCGEPPGHGGFRGVMQVAVVLVCGLGGACVKFYLVLKGAQWKAKADRRSPEDLKTI